MKAHTVELLAVELSYVVPVPDTVVYQYALVEGERVVVLTADGDTRPGVLARLGRQLLVLLDERLGPRISSVTVRLSSKGESKR